MSIGQKPAVFVSSTCYDLAQVRDDLRLFIESIGMSATMSDNHSFPIDPDQGAVANCLDRVKNSADIFVLVVGNRYGSATENGKSVTNLEYEQAKAIGIPIYVFVDKRIIANLPIWQKNKSADFGGIVDSTRLFEFVEKLRSPEENWVFNFESAQDIINALQTQLAYLFRDALQARRRISCADVPEYLGNLSGASLTIAMQRPFGWEYLLFSQVFSDEIQRRTNLKRDVYYEIALDKVVTFDGIESFMHWSQSMFTECIMLSESSERIVNNSLHFAFGEAGKPGNVEEIVYAGKRLGLVYQRLLEMATTCQCAFGNELFVGLIREMQKLPIHASSEIEAFAHRLSSEMHDAIADYKHNQQPKNVVISLKLTAPDMSAYNRELAKLLAANRCGHE
jgi:hypothetical protein